MKIQKAPSQKNEKNQQHVDVFTRVSGFQEAPLGVPQLDVQFAFSLANPIQTFSERAA